MDADRSQIFEKTAGILRVLLKVDAEKVHPTSALKDGLGMDSVDLIDLAGEIERIFGVRIEDEEATVLMSVNDLVELIARKVKA